MRRALCLLMVCWLCMPFFAWAETSLPVEAAENPVLRRALLVGCDRFLSQQDTTPSSYNNVLRMAEALSGGMHSLLTEPAGLASTGELAGMILDAFSDADDNDVSYFYISTHGVWEDGMDAGSMTLLLSDGTRESGVTAWQLRTMFDQIRGRKVLLLDACHAGAMLGKGVPALLENVFAGEDYVVICSSSGAEKSWFWSGEIDGEQLAGAGYFSGALIRALSAEGGYDADDNRDGVITLTELKRCLRATHGASTVQAYPESGDVPLLTYDPALLADSRRQALVENVAFDADVLSAQEPTIYFSFNVVSPVQMAYQLVYYRQGRWDFDNAQIIYDNNGSFSSWPRAGQTLSLGLTERAITLNRSYAADSGYVLLQLLTVEKGVPSVICSRVLCVPPESGDPGLQALLPDYFCPENAEELTFNILHGFPCEMTITIEDMDGQTVRRLCSRESTRPEMLEPSASSFTWDGRDSEGEIAPEGLYRIHVKAYVGSERYEYISEPILLLSLWG